MIIVTNMFPNCLETKITKICTYHGAELLKILVRLATFIWEHFALSLDNFPNFSKHLRFCILTLLFYAVKEKKEVQMRQKKKIHFLKKKDGCHCVNKLWLISCLGLSWQNRLQIVPKNGLLICASNLQVNFYNYKCHSVLISILCLTVILTVILFRS